MARSALIPALFMHESNSAFVACHEQAMIEVDMHSGLVILVRPLDHSTERWAIHGNIPSMCK